MHRRACLFLAAGMAVWPSAKAWGQAAEVAGVKVLRGVLNAPAARADAPTRTSSESVPLVELPPPGPGAFSDAPASFPGFVEPLSNAVGYGNAFASGAQDVAPAGPVPFVTLFSNFAPFETAYFYVNGVYSNAYNMGPFGRLGIYYASIGAGIYRFEMIGTMSGRRAGAASRVVASGAPAVPALAIAPHAVSNSGTGSVTLFGRGFPPSTSVDIRRDGVFVQTTPVGATGLVFQTIDVPAGAESSHVYSVDAGTPGSLVGQSIEVRADAGTPPIGDQNPARAFFDRSVLSTSGGAVSFLGEGFQPMENVDATGCTTATLPADVDGATRAFLIFGAGSGTAACTLTGQTSGRVARASLIQDAKAMTIPGMIVVPTAMKGAGNMVVQIAGMPPSEMGSFELDGTPFLPLTLDASGLGTVTLPRPTTGGVIHTVGWTGVSGGLGSATLLTLNQPVVSDPGDQTVCLGSMASFNASATAAIGPPPTVQWQVSTDGGAMFSDIPAATTSPYVFTPTAADNGHFYRAVFTNANGTAYSRPAVLEVNPAPMITMNPGNAVICANSNASFTVGAAGSALSYQWQVSSGFGYSNVLNGAPYSGATMPTLDITNGTAALDGNLYRCIVAAAGCGPAVSSSGAVLSVDGALPVVYAPAAIAVAQSACQ